MIKHLMLTTLCLAAAIPHVAAKEDRPKVGLVLGGGGALGFAHIGVLQTLEELRIPIDYIGGTSMGSIIGGMYASGMSPAQIEQSLVELDWWDVLKDKSSYQYIDYRRKSENMRFFMNLEFGLKKTGIAFPPGMAYGQKLNNILTTFTANSIGITDFDQLNIPYRAVATDLYSGKSITLKDGDLSKAMRASMAVPGAFTPVRMNSMVLVDGGILNNIPVNVVKEMGADILIAVDVGASAYEKGLKSDYRSLGDVVSRTYALMQRPDQEKMLKLADIVIAPDVTKAKASQFHRIKAIIPPGRTAAMALQQELKKYSISDEEFAEYLSSQRRRRNGHTQINKVNVRGNSKVNETTIRKRIRMKKGPIDIDQIYADLNRIYGMGSFQSVDYHLQANEEGLDLNYTTTEKFWGPSYLHFGMQLETSSDSSTRWSLLLNYNRTEINDLGGEVRIDIEGGGHTRIFDSQWFQPLTHSSALFAEPSFRVKSEDIPVFVDNDEVAENRETELVGAVDAGIHGYEFGQASIGMLAGHVWSETYLGAAQTPSVSDTLVAAAFSLDVDQLNARVFPTRGYKFSVDGRFSWEEIGASETYSTLESALKAPFTLGRHTIAPVIRGGSSLGTDLPIYALFDLGGFNSFAGYAPYQLRGNYYGVGSLEYRYQVAKLPPTLGRKVYAIARFDAGNAWMDTGDIDINNIEFGAQIGMGAETMLGICVFGVGKAEGNSVRAYFSIGSVL